MYSRRIEIEMHHALFLSTIHTCVSHLSVNKKSGEQMAQKKNEINVEIQLAIVNDKGPFLPFNYRMRYSFFY